MSDKSNPYGAPDTGHVWDETLRELTNPPPKWWMIGLHASWILVVVYVILYPAIPLVDTHTKGVMEWTAIGEMEEAVDEVEGLRAAFNESIADKGAAAILADNELTQQTVESAKVLFGDNCAACHGAGGEGNNGFPNLINDAWQWGGSVEAIQATITQGRKGNMMARGMQSNLTDEEIDSVAQHVVALSQGSEYAAGKAIFTGKGMCFACHGADGKGMTNSGLNLTDSYFRFGGDLESVKHTITYGVNTGLEGARVSIMPTFGGENGKLSESEIKRLAVYVYKLSGR